MPDASRGWLARLELAFDREGCRTRLARRAHEGPLVVQKPLYPEGGEVCQCIVVHPPGGIAGGDRLELAIDVQAGAHAQLTTPGAAKWYRAAGRRASQQLRFGVAASGVLEWLPQPTILFDAVDAQSDVHIELEADARYIGWDIVCLGRTASSERFGCGAWRQRIDAVREGALIWSERAALRGGDPLLGSAAGLNGAPVFGTFVAMAAILDDDLIAACRRVSPPGGEGAVTRLPHALVGRYRGESSEAAQDYFRALWAAVRPAVVGRAAVVPRIWNT
ncbi:MAG TPA: urease accessory protein UreD [Casimicrobiaceae bacterium]|nr:urease accessory protein UreD [Casimicrobiaceae bacterium]